MLTKKEKLSDIFDKIPKDGSNIKDEEAEIPVTSAFGESFDSLSSSICASIKELAPTVSLLSDNSHVKAAPVPDEEIIKGVISIEKENRLSLKDKKENNDNNSKGCENSASCDFDELTEIEGVSLDIKADAKCSDDIMKKCTIDKNDLNETVKVTISPLDTSPLEHELKKHIDPLFPNINDVVKKVQKEEDRKIFKDLSGNTEKSPEMPSIELTDKNNIAEICVPSNATNGLDTPAKKELQEQQIFNENMKKVQCEQDKKLREEEDKAIFSMLTEASKDIHTPLVDEKGCIVWRFSPPSEKFRDFYDSKKRSTMFMLCGTEQLPFNRYHDDLISASVNTESYSYDLSFLYEKMQEIQSHRTRILEIKLQGENQYYLWKRHIEMFRGWAARLENAKGAHVDGIAPEHLSDWEAYWGQLESLIKKCDGVQRNLEGAYDCVSRQVTIILQAIEASKDGSRFQKINDKINSNPSEIVGKQSNYVNEDSADGWNIVGRP